MHGHSRILYVAASVLSLILISACSVTNTITTTLINDSQVPQEPPIASQDNHHHQVIIQASTFAPLKVKVKLGDTVTWVNGDADTHTITALYHFQDEDDVSHIFIGEAWDSGDINPGQSYSKTFDQAGTFEYMSLPLHTPSPLDQYFSFVAQADVGVVIVE